MPLNKTSFGHYGMMHLLVIIYGFTPILGKVISISAVSLVWWRLIFSIILLFAYLVYRSFRIRTDRFNVWYFIGTGCIVGLHWAAFYQSIKVSNINTAMCGFATMTLFTALLEPLFFRRKISSLEILLGITTFIGLGVISYKNEVQLAGILYGILAAVTAAIFVNINALLSRKHHAYTITFYEFVGAFLALCILSFFSSEPAWEHLPGRMDIFWLLILSGACTVFPFIEATKISRYINPFTMVLINNLEPVYGILLAFIFFSSSEVMNLQFYIGALLIISGILIYPYVKYRKLKRVEKG